MAKWGTCPPDEQLRLKRDAAEEMIEWLRNLAVKAKALESALVAAERDRDAAIEALRKIAYLRPAGACKNKVIIEMEGIAVGAIERKRA